MFPIVQGGLDEELRKICSDELLQRQVRGYAVGGLRYGFFFLKILTSWCVAQIEWVLFSNLYSLNSGGERKADFTRIVDFCTNELPEDKPRYLMGVGFAEDLVVCVALGIDMFDCVFPTRTAVSDSRSPHNFSCAKKTQIQYLLQCSDLERLFGVMVA